MNAIVEPKNEVAAAQAPQLPIRNYNEFYRFYLTEHRNITSRRLHVLGSAIGGYFIAKAIRHRKPKYVLYGLLPGYACAWVGHFMFEKNKPASFKQPLYSFISDWRMLSDIARGNLSLKCRSLDKIPS
ncbi:Mpo1-like protein [Acinetobacter sp. NigerLNRRAM0016]